MLIRKEILRGNVQAGLSVSILLILDVDSEDFELKDREVQLLIGFNPSYSGC